MSPDSGGIIWLLLLSPQEANSQFKTFSVYDVDPDTHN